MSISDNYYYDGRPKTRNFDGKEYFWFWECESGYSEKKCEELRNRGLLARRTKRQYEDVYDIWVRRPEILDKMDFDDNEMSNNYYG
jgi:hypothetical protein